MFAAHGRLTARLRAFAVASAVVATACDAYSKEQRQEMRSVQEAVTAHPASLNAPNARQLTPLHVAVLNNYLPLIDWLRGRGADPNVHGHYGDTPLHLAVISDRTADHAVLRALLAMGADLNATNDYDETPLHRAAFHGATDIARLLVEHGADHTRRARRGETALIYAARPDGHPDTARALIEAGADANAADTSGMTPLHGAAMIGDVDVARVLVVEGRADVNRTTSAGYTPLHVAAAAGHAAFVRLLLELGADKGIRDAAGLTPLERAQRFPAVRVTKEGKAPVDTSGAIEALRE